MRQVQIANVEFNFHSNHIEFDSDYYESFQDYQGQLGVESKWDIFLAQEEVPDLSKHKVIFDSQGSWKAFAGESKDELYFQHSGFVNPEKCEIICSAKLNLSNQQIDFYPGVKSFWNFPIDELVFINAFSQHNSLLVHSCLYEYEGKGYLFGGVSGAGKSTLADILTEANIGGTVLCDERNAITRDSDGHYWASSTPWIGSSEACVPKTVPLEKILFLNPEHRGASIRELSLQDAVTDFLLVIFPPLFSDPGMRASVDLISELAEKFELCKMNYDKESSDVVELLKSEVFSQG